MLMERRAFLVGALTSSLVACSKGAATSEEIGPLLAPAALATRVEEIRSGKVVVLYVGPDALFGRGHVPGAKNIGEAGTEAGRKAISAALAQAPADSEVVLYCGCCPVANCPNVRPASAVLRALGRTNARVLDLPTRFTTDWAEKGYPVEKS